MLINEIFLKHAALCILVTNMEKFPRDRFCLHLANTAEDYSWWVNSIPTNYKPPPFPSAP